MDTLRVGTRNVAPQPRALREMQSVIFDKEWLRGANVDQSLYFMYRDCVLPEDQEIARQLEIRYDITVLPPMHLGQEYNKTKGHYHSERVPGLCYPELYQVLEGQAHVLLQKRSGTLISDVIVVIAQEGDLVLVPANYGHITINPSERTLKMANWVSTRVQSFYEPFEEKGGGAYFEIEPSPVVTYGRGAGAKRFDAASFSESGRIKTLRGEGLFIPNPNYGPLPPLRGLPAPEYTQLGLRCGQPIYELIKTPKLLRFLSYPEEFGDILKNVY